MLRDFGLSCGEERSDGAGAGHRRRAGRVPPARPGAGVEQLGPRRRRRRPGARRRHVLGPAPHPGGHPALRDRGRPGAREARRRPRRRATHCWGNQLYAERGTEIIGHRECAARLATDVPPTFLAELSRDPGSAPPHLRFLADALADFDFTGIELTPPDTVLDDELLLDIGGTEARVVYVGPAHTAGDVVVHVPERGVVFTGDILFHECTPIGWEGTSARWVEALRYVESLEPDVVVPGHGPLASVEGVRAMRDYLTYVYEEARLHFDAGRSVLDACKRVDLGPYADWTEPERLAMNVARAYRELRGGSWEEAPELTTVAADITALREHYRGSQLTGSRPRIPDVLGTDFRVMCG
ncbi:MAG: MBL fold metallo-hydrolase [Acidimicrobiia bacterium]|nr:MBL fold metallo-hydrolase [Acidimicrobiia bacterium]